MGHCKDLEDNALQETAEVFPLRGEMNIKNISTVKKLKYLKNNITVEPVYALYTMSSVILIITMQNLCLEKACLVDLKYDEDVCTDLKMRKTANHTFEEEEVQKLMASVQALKNSLPSILPIIVVLFLGAWSDKTGRRKICLWLPILGELVTCVCHAISIYFFYEIPVDMTAFMQIFFLAISGGWYTIILGSYSYVSDITSEETRTFRLGILNMCMSIGYPLGITLSGFLLQWFGHYGVIAVATTIFIFLFCYIYFFIEDHTWLQDKKKQMKRNGCSGCLITFFDVRIIKDTVGVMFRKRPKNDRLKICLIMIVACFFSGPIWGELSVLYIFTRYRFNWDGLQYSIFYTYNHVIHSVGTLFSITVFSKVLKMDDTLLGLLSAISKIGGSLVLAFARYDYEAYLYVRITFVASTANFIKPLFADPLVEIFNGTTEVAMKSIASKLVSQQELGKLFSLFGIVEAITCLLVTPIYSWIYVRTLDALPGAFMIFSAMSAVPVFLIYVWFYREHKIDERTETVAD